MVSNESPGSEDLVSSFKEVHPYFAHAGKIEKGSLGTFGRYKDERIKWRVLDIQDERALLLSENALVAMPYNNDHEAVTWSECTLRKWLNGDFLNTAFDPAERVYIFEVLLANEDNPRNGMPGGPDTQDKVFCLSINEVLTYFEHPWDRVCFSTHYAKENGAWAEGRGAGYWWLRSQGVDVDVAAYVNPCGNIEACGRSISLSGFGVRPALWLNLHFRNTSQLRIWD